MKWVRFRNLLLNCCLVKMPACNGSWSVLGQLTNCHTNIPASTVHKRPHFTHHHGMAGTIPELTHGVPCPVRDSFCPGNVKIDHPVWICGCSLMSALYFVSCLNLNLMKMHKNCGHHSCSFWLRYTPYSLWAGTLPQTPVGKCTVLHQTI